MSWICVADFPAEFVHISNFDICHEIQLTDICHEIQLTDTNTKKTTLKDAFQETFLQSCLARRFSWRGLSWKLSWRRLSGRLSWRRRGISWFNWNLFWARGRTSRAYWKVAGKSTDQWCWCKVWRTGTRNSRYQKFIFILVVSELVSEKVSEIV